MDLKHLNWACCLSPRSSVLRGPAGRALRRHLEALQNFGQGVPRFHFSLGLTDAVSGPALSLCFSVIVITCDFSDGLTLPEFVLYEDRLPWPDLTWPLLLNASSSSWQDTCPHRTQACGVRALALTQISGFTSRFCSGQLTYTLLAQFPHFQKGDELRDKRASSQSKLPRRPAQRQLSVTARE